MTFNCLTSFHPPSYPLIENRSNIVYHQGTSFNEPMLIHHLETLSRRKAGSEQLPTCTKLQADTGHRLSWCLAPTRHQPLWSSDFVGSRTSYPQAGRTPAVLLHGTACGGCGKTRKSQETSLHSKATDGCATGWWIPPMHESSPAQPRAPPCLKDEVLCSLLLNHQDKITDGFDITSKQRHHALHLNTFETRAQGRWVLFWKAGKPK